LAERVGFEPTVGYKPTPVFKTGTFNRSVTSPKLTSADIITCYRTIGSALSAQEYRKTVKETTPANMHVTVHVKVIRVSQQNE
jgi:hypothetical protein